MSSMDEQISSAIQASLAPFLDEDICEYIQSTLAEDPTDSDACDAVKELISGSIDTDEDVEQLIAGFFERLNLDGGSAEDDKNEIQDDDVPLRKLTSAITLKDKDITTFASGLSAEEAFGEQYEGSTSQSSVASFYANMLDLTNEKAISERKRRKERQKAIREELEEAERKRALQDTMDMLSRDDIDGDGSSEDALDSRDHSADIHITNLDLPNLRGGGPDLLINSQLILARGRRYGLMGRNGCGKTTFLTYMSQRQVPIPEKMSMLLVRQEIIGNENTAIETVLKSDFQREGVKRFIKWCEEELERLEKGDSADSSGDGPTNQEEKKASDADDKKSQRASKSRQKLQEKKKAKMKKAARSKVIANGDRNIKLKAKQIESQKLKLSEKLGKAYQRLAQIEEEQGGDPEPRARKVLSGLGFSTEMQDRKTSELSGGWRMRVSISCALFANPSLLLLDEPTNHLDLESVFWLEQYLTTEFKGTLVVVSHDRHFLNEVVTDVTHFHKSKLTTYRGDITNFETVREEDKQRQIRLRENQEAKKAHLQKYIDLHSQAGENGVKAARQRKSKMKKLDKIGVMAAGEGKKWKASYDGDAEEVEEFEEDEVVELTFPDPGSFDGNIITVDRAVFGYTKDKLLLNDVDLNITMKSRVALLGRNGCGKSTLIKLMVGLLEPIKGQVKINGTAKIEYLAQHQLEQLDPDATPIQTMIERYPGDQSNAHALSLRRYLANFGLGGEILPKQRISTMSGGQKCRLCLAAAMYRKPHLLILDEPTNHLDLETSEALIKALNEFQGGVLLVSHDQYLLTSVCKDLYVVENGMLDRLQHGSSTSDAFAAYRKDIIKGKR